MYKRQVYEVASTYSSLEYDFEQKSRGHRNTHVEKLLCELLNVEAAIVVNNNAAGVMLVLSTLARDREVIVSRGELVEIGGSFRIPEIMEESRAILRGVGTVSYTHLKIRRNDTPRHGDVLVLTKPLGTGALSTGCLLYTSRCV